MGQEVWYRTLTRVRPMLLKSEQAQRDYIRHKQLHWAAYQVLRDILQVMVILLEEFAEDECRTNMSKPAPSVALLTSTQSTLTSELGSNNVLPTNASSADPGNSIPTTTVPKKPRKKKSELDGGSQK